MGQKSHHCNLSDLRLGIVLLPWQNESISLLIANITQTDSSVARPVKPQKVNGYCCCHFSCQNDIYDLKFNAIDNTPLTSVSKVPGLCSFKIIAY